MSTATKTARSLIARGTSNAAFTQLTGASVTRSGNTATLTKNSHGLSNGDVVLIQGFELEEFNGVFTISNVSTNTFDYTIKQDPGANPSGTPGTVDKVTLSSAFDLSTAFGGLIVGHVQNKATGPTIAAQVWLGLANANNEYDYLWRQVALCSVTAAELNPFVLRLDPETMYAKIAVCRNTAQAVDCTFQGHEFTSFS